MWLAKIVLGAVVLYGVVVLVAYLLQTWLIFPSGLASGGPELPAHAQTFDLDLENDTRVVVTYLPAAEDTGEQRPALLGFGGNAWNADAVALLLHQRFPGRNVAAMHFRGYAPSTGQPSARALFADAVQAHDLLAARLDGAGLVAVGFSIGASVAVELAAERPLRGLVLVTPFDSLRELAAAHYPWLPVRWLLRHRMDSAATLASLDVPTAVITAGRDTIVPAARSDALRAAAGDLRADISIEGAGHNDIYAHPAFAEALNRAVEAVSAESAPPKAGVAPGRTLP